MFILPGASLFTKKAFEHVGRFDERLSSYEDDDLFVRMFSAGIRSVYLRESAVTKWRTYSGSTSFSPRMAKSRMIYFRKLVADYPDDPRLNLYWARDMIGPRFFSLVRTDFIDGMRLNDVPRVEQAWSDLQEILPVLQKRRRWCAKLVTPIIGVLYRTQLKSLTRALLSFGYGGQRKKKMKRDKRRSADSS